MGFGAGVVFKLLLQQHGAPRMTLLGLIVDLSDLACHLVVTIRERANLDVIGSRPLLVGFDSSLQLVSTRLKLPGKLHICSVRIS